MSLQKLRNFNIPFNVSIILMSPNARTVSAVKVHVSYICTYIVNGRKYGKRVGERKEAADNQILMCIRTGSFFTSQFSVYIF